MENFVSVSEFVSLYSDPSKKLSDVAKKFLRVFSQSPRYENIEVTAYKASDNLKTKHILMKLEILADIVTFPEHKLASFFKYPFSPSIYDFETRQFEDLETIAGCKKMFKLAKLNSRLEEMNERIRLGPVITRKFLASYPKYSQIICLDIEAFEFAHHKILEIGFSVFDLSSKSIMNEHIIIQNNLHLRNSKYLPDYRHRFNFGDSVVLGLQTAIQRVHEYLSRPNICLIGHNVDSDIDFLKVAAGYKVSDIPIYDTQHVYQEKYLDFQPISLSRLLELLNLSYTYLHNAGNDSHYTLQAFLALVGLLEK